MKNINVSNIPDFIRADKANRKTMENLVTKDKKFNKIVKDVFNKINIAISEGQFYVIYPINYNDKDTLKIFLNICGYEVTERWSLDDTEWLLTIYWKNKY